MRKQSTVWQYLAEIGRKGGLSRSERKIAAGRINAAKATAARMAKRRERAKSA